MVIAALLPVSPAEIQSNACFRSTFTALTIFGGAAKRQIAAARQLWPRQISQFI
jgi:hypothetical protein